MDSFWNRIEFHKRVQNPGEDIDAFASSLLNLASNCDHQGSVNAVTDELLRDRFLAGLEDQDLLKRTIDNVPNIADLSFANVLQLVLAKTEHFSHENAAQYQCHKCHESFETRKALSEHNHNLHKPLKKPQKSKNVEALDEFTLFCQECQQEFETYTDTRRHKKEVHGITETTWTGLACVYCGAKHRPKIMLRLHVVTLHPLKAFPCDDCDEMFANDTDYEQHCQAIHAKPSTPLPRNNMCPYCNETFEMLGQHMMYKHEKKTFLCHVCDFRHSTKGGLAAHVKVMHPKEKDLKSCHLCDYKTAVGHNLKVHIEMVHEKKLKFQCNLCGIKCYTTNRLNRHIQTTHMGLKTYACKECDEKFKYDSGLRRHVQQVHRNEDISFVCQVCASSYKQRKSLKRHMAQAHNIIEVKQKQSKRQVPYANVETNC